MSKLLIEEKQQTDSAEANDDRLQYQVRLKDDICSAPCQKGEQIGQSCLYAQWTDRLLSFPILAVQKTFRQNHIYCIAQNLYFRNFFH